MLITERNIILCDIRIFDDKHGSFFLTWTYQAAPGPKFTVGRLRWWSFRPLATQVKTPTAAYERHKLSTGYRPSEFG